MKLAIVGSRGFRDYRLLNEKVSELSPELVISGGARGADKLGETWAKKNDIETQIFLPEFKKYRHPYHHRNRLIVEACDELIAFWDGSSTGTKYTIDYARKMNKPVTIVRY